MNKLIKIIEIFPKAARTEIRRVVWERTKHFIDLLIINIASKYHYTPSQFRLISNQIHFINITKNETCML